MPAEVASDIVHWQHFHGFKDNRDAACPTEDTGDAKDDDIIDLIETEPTAGTTMVPFDDDPVAMDIAGGTYPKAGPDGTFQYQKIVSPKNLHAAFAKHSVTRESISIDASYSSMGFWSPPTSLLPSLRGAIPAQVTLPITCGEIKRVQP